MNDLERHFLEQVAEMAREMDAFSEVTPREDELALDLKRDADDAESMIAYLQNLYAETRDVTPDERAGRIRYFLEGVSEPPEQGLDWEEAKTRIFSVIRSPAMFAALPPGRPVVAKRTLPYLVECVALDLGRTFSYVTEADLKLWGADPDELYELARANIEQKLEHSIEPWDVAAPYPMWHLSADDAYESSRLLAPSFLRAMREHVTGTLVIAIPERSTMLLVGDASNDALARLADTAEREYMSSTRGISPALYTLDEGGQPTPYLLSNDHPLFAIVARGHALLANAEYAEQKRILDADHEAKDIDLFVASFIATQRDDEIRTIATWSQDVDTLLPVADFVAFVALDEENNATDSILVPWDTVERIVGDCLEEDPTLWPPRRRTLRYPNAEQLTELRASAIE